VPPVPPIGLDYLYEPLLKEGHEVSCFDFQIDGRENLKAKIINENPEIIGITLRNIDNAVMLDQIEFISSYVRIVKEIKRYSDAPVVLGGAGFSIMPFEILKETDADYGVIGDGEKTFSELLRNLSCPDKIPNLVYKRFHNNVAEYRINKLCFHDIESVPTHSRALINYREFYRRGGFCNIFVPNPL